MGSMTDSAREEGPPAREGEPPAREGEPEETPASPRGHRRLYRHLAEAAAVLSALAAVAGVIVAVLDQSADGDSGARRQPSPTRTVPTPADSAPGGWSTFDEPGLTVSFKVPDGWKRVERNATQSRWRSPDDTFSMAVKRDNAWGPTVRETVEGQLTWYRDTGQSEMTDLDATQHRTVHDGRPATWVEIDYRWAPHSPPRKRIELFVPGEAGYVYQLLVDADATPDHLAKLRRLFATARAGFRPDAA